MADKTVVVFRKWEGGQIIALFPEIPADPDGDLCISYEHMGQHGSADHHHVVSNSVLAHPHEYASLRRELESEPYNYNLVIRARCTQQMIKHRKAAARKKI